MPQEPTKKQPKNVVTDPNLQEEIRCRAYALYEERGREGGRSGAHGHGSKSRRLTSAHLSMHKPRQSWGLSSLLLLARNARRSLPAQGHPRNP
jgi:hypothetical protein